MLALDLLMRAGAVDGYAEMPHQHAVVIHWSDHGKQWRMGLLNLACAVAMDRNIAMQVIHLLSPEHQQSVSKEDQALLESLKNAAMATKTSNRTVS